MTESQFTQTYGRAAWEDPLTPTAPIGSVDKSGRLQIGKRSGPVNVSIVFDCMGLPHTASASRSAKSQLDVGISNLVVETGDQSLTQLLAKYPRAIYITDFTGYHAGYNDGSGDFSLQSEGELWEHGKRVRPLANFVTSGNILQFLKDVEAVSSRRLHPTSSVIAPDLLVPSLSIAGA